jgi:hypothetical protein
MDLVLLYNLISKASGKLFTSLLITVCGCGLTSVAQISDTLTSILNREISASHFEYPSESGYIRIENDLPANPKKAIVIRIDTVSKLEVYELRNSSWCLMYHQDQLEFDEYFRIGLYFEDFNFDGRKDIALRSYVSNGTAIMTFQLWLFENNSFLPVPEFQTIGNPVILPNRKIIQGFTACCVFGEIKLTNYKWVKEQLIPVNELEISNYSGGINAQLKMSYPIITKTIRIGKKGIRKLLNIYSKNWSLIGSFGAENWTFTN